MRNFLYIDKKEAIETGIAIAVLTFIFSFEGLFFNSNLLTSSFIATVTAYLFHELAHKYVAIKLGYYAKFRLYIPSTLFSLILAFTGVKVAAPGWVEVRPYKFKDWLYRRIKFSEEEIGKIALAGPLTNIILAYIFLLLGLNFFKSVNAWIAFFNLIPIPPLDGSKVLDWKFGGWAFFLVLSIILVIV